MYLTKSHPCAISSRTRADDRLAPVRLVVHEAEGVVARVLGGDHQPRAVDARAGDLALLHRVAHGDGAAAVAAHVAHGGVAELQIGIGVFAGVEAGGAEILELVLHQVAREGVQVGVQVEEAGQNGFARHVEDGRVLVAPARRADVRDELPVEDEVGGGQVVSFGKRRDQAAVFQYQHENPSFCLRCAPAGKQKKPKRNTHRPLGPCGEFLSGFVVRLPLGAVDVHYRNPGRKSQGGE